jgi:hypothetical protein
MGMNGLHLEGGWLYKTRVFPLRVAAGAFPEFLPRQIQKSSDLR